MKLVCPEGKCVRQHSRYAYLNDMDSGCVIIHTVCHPPRMTWFQFMARPDVDMTPPPRFLQLASADVETDSKSM
jgi:hypothetical protein